MSGRTGFTLIEIVVVAAILVVVAGLFLTSFLTAKNSYLSADAYVEVQQEARHALDGMSRELRAANGATMDATQPNQLTFQVALGYNLTGVPGCPADATCWGARDANGANQPTWRVRYTLTGGQLLRQLIDAGNAVQPGTRVLANDVNQASFAYNGGSMKTVDLRLNVLRASQQLPGGSVGTSQLTSTIRLRNN